MNTYKDVNGVVWKKDFMQHVRDGLLEVEHVICEDCYAWETHSNPQVQYEEAPVGLHPLTTEIYHFEPEGEDCEKAVDTFWYGNEKNKEHWKEGYLHTVFLLMLAGY